MLGFDLLSFAIDWQTWSFLQDLHNVQGVIGCTRIGRLVGRGFTMGRAVIAIMVMAWGTGALKRRMSGMGRFGLGRMRFGGRGRRGSGMFVGVGCAGREGTCGVRGGFPPTRE